MELPDVDLSQQHNFNFVCHSALCLFNSWKGWNKGVFLSQKREYRYGNIGKGFHRIWSTLFFSLISSAALFFFLCDYSYVNYAST